MPSGLALVFARKHKLNQRLKEHMYKPDPWFISLHDKEVPRISLTLLSFNCA